VSGLKLQAAMAGNNQEQCFVFVFPMASGHLNPSLPIARSLVKLGHAVHYVCAEQMREAIHDTGATFHCERQVFTEMFEGRPDDLMEVYASLFKEYGLQDEFMRNALKIRNIALELKMSGMIRVLQELKPSAVVYCPLSCHEAAWAAKFEDIPHIGLNTIAGPGAMKLALENFIKQFSMTIQEFDEELRSFQPHLDAQKRLQEKYCVNLESDGGMDKPYGRLGHLAHAALTLVTTTEDFYDPIPPELQKALEADNANFVAVGPLLDELGAKRAAGHKSNHHAPKDNAVGASKMDSLGSDAILEMVTVAKKEGRKVVLASMGTVITGDMGGVGWEGRPGGRGLTGRELCQGAWGGVFDAFGASTPSEGPLVVLALGPQANALGELIPPANAVCAPVLPQVDLLKVGVDLFLTHGGQNSFTEALANSTPVVVVPGFGDQPVNAQKAVDIRVGLKVDRPDPDAGQESQAVVAYRSAVKAALLDVFANSDFKGAASRCGRNLQKAGGVSRAVQLVLSASRSKETSNFAAATRAGA